MSKFDTHGGVFAPQGYMRVNAGGSHEENPNGGVQVGVDPEGVPNVLEEGEPVYNDYVYSDNIVAEKEILEKHNIPVKYAGKLYSVIADTMVDAVAEMPFDPIANNGLEEMLVRLADAQEEQKAVEQQKELEKELESMSPEELAELEQMLAEQEAAAAQPQQPMMMPQEQVPMQQPQMQPDMQDPMMLQQPMMACGGQLKRSFWPGGLLPIVPGMVREGTRRAIEAASDAKQAFDDTKVGQVVERIAHPYDGEMYGEPGALSLFAGPTAVAGPIKAAQLGKRAATVNAAMDAAYSAAEATKAAKTVSKAKKAADTVKKVASGTRERMDMSGWGKMFYDPSFVARRAAQTEGMSGWGKTWRGIVGTQPALIWEGPALTKAIGYGIEWDAANRNATTTQQYKANNSFDPLGVMNLESTGGPLNTYPRGGKLLYDGNKITAQGRVTPFRLSGGANPYFWITPRSVAANSVEVEEPDVQYSSPVSLNPSLGIQRLQPITTRSISAAGASVPQPRTVSSARKAASVATTNIPVAPATAVPVENTKTFDTVPASVWQQLYDQEEDQKIKDYLAGEAALKELNDMDIPVEPIDASRNDWQQRALERQALPTWPRYAKALTAAGLGIYNAFQDPYQWNIPRVNPVLPYGRMHLVDPVYNPLDQNQVTNDVLASGAGNARTMLYAAPGSSLPSTLLAHDYNVGRNMGNAATAVWDANNQRRNAVIAAHNQNASTLGNFHYGQNRDRAQILNDFVWRNAHNDLMRQRLAYEDEAARYQAVGNQINAVADALAGIGQENFAMNQLNSNSAFYYGLGPNGWGYYKKPEWYGKCGGKMKK